MFFQIEAAALVPPSRLQQYNSLLSVCGLKNENDADYTALLFDGDKLVACGSLKGNILKQIAVDKEAEGSGACASIVSTLITEAYARGFSHLFLFTKPEHERLFTSLGFFSVCKTDKALMMENNRNGVNSFINGIPKYSGNNGCVICNCDPMTRGHLHLIKYAASHCDHLYVFVVSENGSMFPPHVRYTFVKNAVASLENVSVHQSGAYIISKATFPTYFIRSDSAAEDAWMDIDITIFAQSIAPALGINKRFVGEEPFSVVTNKYNQRMKELLAKFGIELIEIPRLDSISASKVRKLLADGDVDGIQPLVNDEVYAYCKDRA
ncbi:MAG: [citrate (pro-3S)-lyase] ligase [Eubacteriales bacterium]|nr:[citrate (pro-3S)-lyase] ligase [Eubacteriales bacterium]